MRRLSITVILSITGISAGNVYAQSTDTMTSADFMPPYWLEYTLMATVIILAIVIAILALIYNKLMTGVASGWLGPLKKGLSLAVPFLLLVPENAFAATSDSISGSVSLVAFFLYLVVVAIELIIIFFLFRGISRTLKSMEPVTSSTRTGPAFSYKIMPFLAGIWARLNKSVAIEKEKEIMSHHEYDGIRELDNDLPPWWKWGFVFTIIFSVIYLWRYHVTESAPLQEQELEIQLAEAEQAMIAYRAQSANLVDETNVTISEDPEYLAKGRAIFVSNCAACHLENGAGSVGPNMTDRYWLHGNDISSIFKVIKYGVVEKGMQSWKEMLSPTQIAQVANYIKTLEGTDVGGGKEPQGELLIEENTEEIPSGDTTQQEGDSL